MCIPPHHRISASDGNVGRIPFWRLDGRAWLLPFYCLAFGVSVGAQEDGLFSSHGVSFRAGGYRFILPDYKYVCFMRGVPELLISPSIRSVIIYI
jgi:hypothetical protein